MADRKQGAVWSSGSSAGVHKANYRILRAIKWIRFEGYLFIYLRSVKIKRISNAHFLKNIVTNTAVITAHQAKFMTNGKK